ncbi:MAG: zinc ribbon domain-containing protein [Myxococcales bacterium]|nr:zinc ribbon domain-containing protein [Myxococcales bacterium]
MPIYEYECTACSHAFEEWQKISDPPVRKCPKCGKRKVERVISATAFTLKGGGWYKDLYSSSKKGGGSSDGGGSSTTSSSESSGSSKAAASAE